LPEKVQNFKIDVNAVPGNRSDQKV